MKKWNVQVRVWLKPSVFDPQGHAVQGSLATLGFEGVERVRIGKYMELNVTAPSQEAAEDQVRKICDTVLCNPVMETYAFTVAPTGASAPDFTSTQTEVRS